jgi:hypothetical protein
MLWKLYPIYTLVEIPERLFSGRSHLIQGFDEPMSFQFEI